MSVGPITEAMNNYDRLTNTTPQRDTTMNIATRVTTDHPFKRYWTSNDSCCEICGREFVDAIPPAEMFHPDDRYADFESVVCHERCGRARRMEHA